MSGRTKMVDGWSCHLHGWGGVLWRPAFSVPLLGTICTSLSFVYRVYLPAKTGQIGSTCSIASLVVLLSGSVSAAVRRQTGRSDQRTEGISLKVARRRRGGKHLKSDAVGGDVPSATLGCVDPRVLYIIQTGRINLLWMSGKVKIVLSQTSQVL